MGQLIGLHFAVPPRTLDATWGRGVMWRGCLYQPSTRFDVRPMPGVDVIGEWRDLPSLFRPGTFQLVVWDPPHQTDGGERAFTKGVWAASYGTAADDLRGHANITHLYDGFLQAARPILEPGGLLLAKIADQVHGGVQQLQAVELVIAARTAGWTVCEMVPKMRHVTPNDPRWRRQLHVRKAWSYWIGAHPGPRCTAMGVRLFRSCDACGREFRARRRDAKTCSGRCRSRLHDTLRRSAAQQLSVSSVGHA